jgi:small conductance mechanosensitive channel|tara:strand:+ start:380 stop:898 length:519 start_codon:yes stop_codon:yes gene_type:complete
MLEELASQAQEYISQRYLAWGLAAVGLLIGSVIIRVVDKSLARFLAKVDYDRTLEILWQRSVKIFLWLVLIILIAGNLGFDVTGFIAGLSVIGFVVGFAVKDVLSNLAAGMFILIKRPFLVGDTVSVAGVTGEILEVNLAACIIFSTEHETVTVPNAKVWGNPIRNVSRNTK